MFPARFGRTTLYQIGGIPHLQIRPDELKGMVIFSRNENGNEVNYNLTQPDSTRDPQGERFQFQPNAVSYKPYKPLAELETKMQDTQNPGNETIKKWMNQARSILSKFLLTPPEHLAPMTSEERLSYSEFLNKGHTDAIYQPPQTPHNPSNKLPMITLTSDYGDENREENANGYLIFSDGKESSFFPPNPLGFSADEKELFS